MKTPRGILAPLGDVRARIVRDRDSGAADARRIKWGKRGLMGRHIGASRPGDIVTVAARTNMGKSHFLLASMREAECPSLYVSLEDDDETVVDRTNDATAEEDGGLILSIPRPISLSMIGAHIETAANTMIEPGQPWIVALDYISLVQDDLAVNAWSQTHAIAHTIAHVRQLGEEYGFVALLSAQIGRPPKGRKTADGEEEAVPRPTLYDIRDSANIENASTDVVLLHGDSESVEAWIAKRKRGPVRGIARYKRGPQGRLIQI